MGIIDAFVAYQFIKRLTKPFNKWPAYKTGVIDSDGNIVTPSDERTPQQKKTFKYFDLLVLNLKKLLAKIPGGSSRFATYTAALWLLKEYREGDLETLVERIDQPSTLTMLKEDMAANNVSSGNIAGMDGSGPNFMGHRVFNVNKNTMNKIRLGKNPHKRYKTYLEGEECGDEIHDYCKKNPNKSVILANNGEMMFFRRRNQ